MFFRKSPPEEERPKSPPELAGLKRQVQAAQLPEHVAAVVQKEFERLEKTDPTVAEYSIGLNYIEYLLPLPWNRATEDNLDLNRAEKIGRASCRERV